ncbi:MAG TPA: Fic family protein [Thermoleophilaceae bacterium]|nr:Fic family protein [Thermoleophilaceae bacterium]
MDDTPTPLSPSQLAELEARYRAIPGFGDWPSELPRLDAWEKRHTDLVELAEAATPEQLQRALSVAVRAAAFDTGAIEDLYRTDRGLTQTVATQAAMWEQAIEEQGPDARPLFEAQLRVYELVLDAATRNMVVNEAWIRRLHEELTGPQETYVVHTPVGIQRHPLPQGQYKMHPNHVKTAAGDVHVYSPVLQTRPEMKRLVTELNSETFLGAHTVAQAAYAHYGLVAIHPFADGNGRVARALASAYLYRGASVPFLVLADQRDDYFQALAAADDGDPLRFIEFVADVGLSTMSMVVESLRAALVPSPDDALKSFRNLFTAQGGLTHAEMDAIGARLADEALSAFKDQAGALDWPAGVTYQVTRGSGSTTRQPPQDFRPIITGGGRYFELSLSSAAPAQAHARLRYDMLVSTSQNDVETFRLQRAGHPDGMTFALRDVYPDLSISARYRLQALAERVLGVELDTLLDKARESLRKTGYRP